MIIDCHIHFEGLELYDKLMADMESNGVEKFNVLVVDRVRDDPDSYKLPHALWLKALHRDRVFVFGGLDLASICSPGHDHPDTPLVEQLQTLMDLGCDGLKLLTGKPDCRKWLNQPLDGPLYEPLLTRLEQTGFPVLWHVGDPPEFWNVNTTPLWARQHGWWYDNSYPTKQQIDLEIQHVFDRHPRLNLILPHFFFMAQDLPAAATLLDRHPNFHLDLAPGVEMFHHFTTKPAETRDFFMSYADRILYGTDSGLGNHCNSPQRSWMVQHFLTSDDTFAVPDDPVMTPDERPSLQGINLPEEKLDLIFSENFCNTVGRRQPAPLNMDLVTTVLENLSAQASDSNCNTARHVLDQWRHSSPA